MKITYIIILLFFCFLQKSYTQEEITNTTIILFDRKDYSPPLKGFYQFEFQNSIILTLVHKEFEDFDMKARKIPMLSLEINKSFIKKNKHLIYNYSEIISTGIKEAYNLFSKSKNILLIDKTEIKKRKLKIKKVIFLYDFED